ncbi:hypothetical protein SAMN04487866_12213 [Thermoactinomyces sp. DSM 45891]|uniref:hypothetical protein n=1 Tax=Thermoactinomyces sp. DSM 45891 TaxID=1761907 RepID=UPI00091289ED|nr:hypothetical protein [Thermoactinomyces sp. DSM 45891]SFX74710.1 hypothetical protein SAMN04487866_12213 [Thermoactinomyces sp. DSM 45891]
MKENLPKEWLTVNQIIELTGIPQRTLSGYINTYGHFIQMKKPGRFYYIHEDSIHVIKEIRKLSNNKWTREQIEDHLGKNHHAFFLVPEGNSLVPLGQSLYDISQDVKQFKQDVKQLLQASLEKQQQMQMENQASSNRQQQMMQAEIQSLQKELYETKSVAYAHQKELENIHQELKKKSKRGFFSLFSRKNKGKREQQEDTE